MTTLFILSLIAFAFISLSILIWFVFSGWSNYWLDRQRQELFKIRNDLFNLAVNGKINFDDEAYGIVRITINGSITVLNHFSFWRLLLLSVFARGIEKDRVLARSMAATEKALDKLPIGKKSIYMDTLKKMHMAVLKYIVLSSLLLLTIGIAVTCISSILGGTKNLLSSLYRSTKVQKRFKIFDAEAAIMGEAA